MIESIHSHEYVYGNCSRIVVSDDGSYSDELHQYAVTSVKLLHITLIV